MTRDEIRVFFAKRQQAWDARNPEDLAAGHTAHGSVVSPMFTTVHGREHIAGMYRTLFRMFPDWEYTGEPPIADDDRVAQPFTVRATHSGEFLGFAGTGKRFEIQGVQLFEMQGGLILHERRVYDFTGLLMQIGVLKSKPART